MGDICLTERQASIDDRDQLRAFYEHLSSQSRYFRFFGKPRVGTIVEDVMHALASRDAVTLVAEVDHRIVAVAQYFPTSSAGRAEAAFAIADAHQGRGIGTNFSSGLAWSPGRAGLPPSKRTCSTTTRRCGRS